VSAILVQQGAQKALRFALCQKSCAQHHALPDEKIPSGRTAAEILNNFHAALAAFRRRQQQGRFALTWTRRVFEASNLPHDSKLALWPYCLIAFISIHDGDISNANLSATSYGQPRGLNTESNRLYLRQPILAPLTCRVSLRLMRTQLMELAFCQNTTSGS
jgi:hypothetical protein